MLEPVSPQSQSVPHQVELTRLGAHLQTFLASFSRAQQAAMLQRLHALGCPKRLHLLRNFEVQSALLSCTASQSLLCASRHATAAAECRLLPAPAIGLQTAKLTAHAGPHLSIQRRAGASFAAPLRLAGSLQTLEVGNLSHPSLSRMLELWQTTAVNNMQLTIQQARYAFLLDRATFDFMYPLQVKVMANSVPTSAAA